MKSFTFDQLTRRLLELQHTSDTVDHLEALITEEMAGAWDLGYTAGHSNAMRRMSDEPNAPTSPNPFRESPPAGIAS
jgi:hypothetical protein